MFDWVQRRSPPRELTYLLNYEHGFLDAYYRMRSYLRSVDCKEQLDRICARHRQHVESLESAARDSGAVFGKNEPIITVVSCATMAWCRMSGDRGVATVMASAERHAVKRYLEAMHALRTLPQVIRLLAEIVEDERLHVIWLEKAAASSALQTSCPPPAAGTRDASARPRRTCCGPLLQRPVPPPPARYLR